MVAPTAARQEMGKVRGVESREPKSSGRGWTKPPERLEEWAADEERRHTAIVLRPDTKAEVYEPMVLKPDAAAEDLRIVAGLVAVLG